ncbi:MAG: DUF1244 domain-containing protein [Chromatiales bacterium]|nr:DUF1244 domain-containing protein [Chromatiales bacterium]
MDDNTRTQLEAAVYRKLITHLQNKTEVQNIDLMNLADFCRNCLAKWYVAVAEEHNIKLDYEDAREMIYGMPYKEWKALYQKPMTEEQQAALKNRQSQ